MNVVSFMQILFQVCEYFCNISKKILIISELYYFITVRPVYCGAKNCPLCKKMSLALLSKIKKKLESYVNINNRMPLCFMMQISQQLIQNLNKKTYKKSDIQIANGSEIKTQF